MKIGIGKKLISMVLAVAAVLAFGAFSIEVFAEEGGNATADYFTVYEDGGGENDEVSLTDGALEIALGENGRAEFKRELLLNDFSVSFALSSQMSKAQLKLLYDSYDVNGNPFVEDGKTVYADTEALFVYKEKFYLITKNRGEALIFEADPGEGRRIDARPVGHFNAYSEMTSADVDSAQQRLALLSYDYLYIIDIADGLDNLSDKILKVFSLDCGQCEGVTFTADGGLAVNNEDGGFYKLPPETLAFESSDR